MRASFAAGGCSSTLACSRLQREHITVPILRTEWAVQIEQIEKEKPSRQERVVAVRAARKAARVPVPLRLRRKPDVYADGRASKSDKASPTTAPVLGCLRGCIVRLLLLRLLLLRLLASRFRFELRCRARRSAKRRIARTRRPSPRFISRTITSTCATAACWFLPLAPIGRSSR